MTSCLSCSNWKPRDVGEVQRRMAAVRMAICSLGPRWVFHAPTFSCERHAPAEADVCEARRIWIAKGKK
jgi:hypothetical protein